MAFVLRACLIWGLLPGLISGQDAPSTDSILHSTVRPSGAQIIAGKFSVSVPVSESKRIELDIQTKLDSFLSVTLQGPTTFVSVVTLRTGVAEAPPSPDAQDGTSETTAPSTGSSPSPTITPSPTRNGAKKSGNNTSSSEVLSVVCPDPDCYMAAAMAKVSYTDKPTTPPSVPTGKLTDDCVLWDPNCKSKFDYKQAINDFFGRPNGTRFQLLDDPCFDEVGYNLTTCHGTTVAPAATSLSAAAKSYARGSKCISDYNEYFKLNPETTSLTTTVSETYDSQKITWDWRYDVVQTVPPGTFTLTHAPVQETATDCGCGKCQIYGPNVEVYYWPEDDSDDSCLSIVGDEVHPLLDGVKTAGNGDLYWGTVTNSYDIYVGTKTTARLMTVNGIVLKQALVNPWADDGIGTDMPEITTTRPLSTTSAQDSSTITPAPSLMRFRPRLIERAPPAGNQSLAKAGGNNGPSTTVLDGFTFTSPSIYVAFTSLYAQDQCGWRGSFISTTTIPFAPGELSTVGGHVLGPAFSEPGTTTKSFNFADLPCPPRSVAEANWWKPAPGEPYRPLLALPSNLKKIDPAWSDCDDPYYFTGLDPPRALAGTNALADGPPETPAEVQEKTDPHVDFKDKATGLAPAEKTPDPAVPASKPKDPAAAPTPNSQPQPKPAPKEDPKKDPQPDPKPDPQPAPEPESKPESKPEPKTDPSTDTKQDPKAEYKPADPVKPPKTSPTFKFGSGQDSVDPNKLNKDQAKDLSQALLPTANAPAAQPEPQARPTPGTKAQDPADPKAQAGPPAANQPQDSTSPEDSNSSASSPQTPANSPKKDAPPSQPQNVVIGGSTYDVPQITEKPPAPSVGGKPIIPLSNGRHEVNGQTLDPGGSAVVGGSTIQIDPNGIPIVNGKPVAAASPPAAVTTTAAGHTIVNDGNGGVHVDGVHVPEGIGPPHLVGGTPAWVPQNTPAAGPGQQSPAPAPAPAPTGPITTLPEGQVVSNSNGAYQIVDQTLQPGGPPVTVSGSTYSLDPSSSIHINNDPSKVYSLPLLTPGAASGPGSSPGTNGTGIVSYTGPGGTESTGVESFMGTAGFGKMYLLRQSRWAGWGLTGAVGLFLLTWG